MNDHEAAAAALAEFTELDPSMAMQLGDAVREHVAKRPPKIVHMRAFPTDIKQSDARTLTGLLVPWDTVAEVVDPTPDGRWDQYKEGFKRGAFDPQIDVGARNRGVLTKIELIHRHEGGLGYLGPFIGLRSGEIGLVGDIKVLPSKVDDVAGLLEAGVHELSVEFRLPAKNHTTIDDAGVRWRTRAHLDRVALEPKGAYSSAQVLAFRDEIDALEKADAAEAAEKTAEQEAAAAAEAEVAAAAERKRAWQEMSERLDREQAKQRALVEEYGTTGKPRSYGASW